MIQNLQYITSNFAAACNATGGDFFGLPTWYKYLKFDTTGGACSVAFAFPDDLPLVGLAIVDILLRIAVLVAIGYVIHGGIKYTISQGEPQAIANARETIIGALAGLAIAMIATVIVSFIGNKLGG